MTQERLYTRRPPSAGRRSAAPKYGQHCQLVRNHMSMPKLLACMNTLAYHYVDSPRHYDRCKSSSPLHHERQEARARSAPRPPSPHHPFQTLLPCPHHTHPLRVQPHAGRMCKCMLQHEGGIDRGVHASVQAGTLRGWYRRGGARGGSRGGRGRAGSSCWASAPWPSAAASCTQTALAACPVCVFNACHSPTHTCNRRYRIKTSHKGLFNAC